MGALIRLLSTLFGKTIGFFATYVSYKVAILLASAAAWVALTAALVLVLKALLLAVYVVSPSQFQWAAQFLPDNLSTGIAALVTARVSIWLYQRKIWLLKNHASMN